MLRLFLFSALISLVTPGCTEPSAEKPQRVKEACASHNPQRNVYFGDLHVHTAYSFDAYINDVRNTPDDAYRYAKGETVMVPPLDAQGRGTRKKKLPRPLDFVAVTDHAEFLGEVDICVNPGHEAYASETCRIYREEDFLSSFFEFGYRLTIDAPRRSKTICGENEAACRKANDTVWKRTINAADEAYDWSSDCSFTSLIAYEYTAVPDGSNMHRNVIFRNNHVPARPISFFDVQKAEHLWEGLQRDCLNGTPGCDVLAIPHNPNLSNGRMFNIEYSGDTLEEQKRRATLQAAMEPVVEIFQRKGDAECSNNYVGLLGEPDEFCAFEKIMPDSPDCLGKPGAGGQVGVGCTGYQDFVRAALLIGLAEDERIGVNPLRLGIIGSTDGHKALPGSTEEYLFEGDLTPGPFPLGGGRKTAGGLTAVWAEENSRESIFDAVRRKEVFGTSGTRLSVRMFGGWEYDASMCEDPEMLTAAYEKGVPMGGMLPERSGSSPTFLLAAMRDPGTEEYPGAPLERIQVVKGWIENGSKHYKVFDAAGDPSSDAGVDESCRFVGKGFDSLCSVWKDPQFDSGKRAFYYARVLEAPTCRWHKLLCMEASEAERTEVCDDPSIPETIQERAWSSPIWYKP